MAPINIFNISCDKATYILDILRSVEMYLNLCRLIFPVSCSFGFILCYVTGLMWSVGVLKWKRGHAFTMDLYKIFSINYRRQLENVKLLFLPLCEGAVVMNLRCLRK